VCSSTPTSPSSSPSRRAGLIGQYVYRRPV
jgi:hypothetical protein